MASKTAQKIDVETVDGDAPTPDNVEVRVILVRNVQVSKDRKEMKGKTVTVSLAQARQYVKGGIAEWCDPYPEIV